jgi:hypothetical protein
MLINETRRNEDRAQDQAARHMQGPDGIGKDECGEDVERGLFRHPQQCRQDDFLRLPLDDLDNRGLFDSPRVQELPEYRCFENAEPNPQTDPNENDGKRERDPPAPGSELIA